MTWRSLFGWAMLAVLALWLLRDREAIESSDGSTWLAYGLGPDEQVRFDLTETGRPVRLQVWLEHNPTWSDVRNTEEFGLRWTALNAKGAVIETQTNWVDTRKGWKRPAERNGPLEPVATTESSVLHDPRTERIAVPPGTTRLVIDGVALEPGERIHVIAFEEASRDAMQQTRAVLGADVEQSGRLAERVGRWQWDELPESWKLETSQIFWRRLASVDQDTRPERVVSANQFVGFEDAAGLGRAVPMGGASAFALEGTSIFEGRWTEEDGVTPRPTRTWLEIVGEGLGEVRDLGMVTTVGPLAFEPGVREVRIARDSHDVEGTPLLRATTEGPLPDRAWGDPPRLSYGDHQWLAPDLTGLFYWRTAENDPLVFDVPPDHDVRVVARPRLGPGRLPGLGPADVEMQKTLTVERTGVDAWKTSVEVLGQASAYERYTRGDDPSTARVSEETEWYLGASSRGGTLRVSGDDVDVQVFVKELYAPSDVAEPGYPLDALPEAVRARYLPFARRTWRAQFPLDADRLLPIGRDIRIDAQVRWVYRSVPSSSGLSYRTLELPPPFELVAERRAGGSRTRVTRKASTLLVPPNGRLMVDYRVQPNLIGKPVVFTIGDKVVEEELLAAGGTVRLDGLKPGPSLVKVNRAGVFLANTAGPKPWAVRRVWRLDPGRARRIPIPKGGEGISVHVARRSSQGGGAMVWALEGEGMEALPLTTQRRSGRRALQSALAEAVVMTRADSRWTWVDPLRLRLGGRMDGTGTLVLSLEERGDPVWISVTTTWSDTPNAIDPRHWALQGRKP